MKEYLEKVTKNILAFKEALDLKAIREADDEEL